MPIAAPMSIESAPTARESPIAIHTRAKRSLPVSSVPNQWSAEGGLNISSECCPYGEYGQNLGVINTNKINANTMVKPILIRLFIARLDKPLKIKYFIANKFAHTL
jgi:hypothetical protein